MTDVYILSASRSAIGSFGGSLKNTSASHLGQHIAKAAIKKSGLDAGAIDHAVIGNVIHTEPRDMYISRRISILAGMAEEAPALTVNRLCGSGLQAIVSAAQLIMLGDAKAVLAGGVETMSRSGHLMTAIRQGQRMGDAVAHDMMLGALHDPFDVGHMGMTAEHVGAQENISRAEQDAFALRSQQRAKAAQEAGYFTQQIEPIDVRHGRQTTAFSSDEYIRDDASLDGLGKLPTIFMDGGRVTAGNSSGINDGASALVLASGETAKASNTRPMAKIISYGFGGVAPRVMGLGPVPATRMALDKAGLKISDIDVIESNEAFAAQACAVSKLLSLPDDIVNPNGGAIALGHPIGATGAILMTKLVYELKRRDARYGLATMCIGGGQGISVIIDTKL